MSDLVDVWFTEEQLHEIIFALNLRVNVLNEETKKDEIHSIISHLEHCLQKRNFKQWNDGDV